MSSVGIAGRLCLLRAYGVGGGITARDCCLLEHLGGSGGACAALLGMLGGGIDLVVGYRVGRRYLELKGGLAAQVLSVALDSDLRLGGRDGIDGAVGRDGGGSDGERVVARQQLDAAAMLVHVERFAHRRAIRILTAHLHGDLRAGRAVEPRGTYADSHRHHGMRIRGNSGGLLLPVSVPRGISCATGDQRDRHDAGNHQIATLGRHLATAILGFACRGNGRQGDIAHGDGLIDSRRRTQAGELAGQRILGRQAAEQDGFLARVGFGLVICLAFEVFVICLIFDRRSIIVGILFAMGFRLALRVELRIVKRNLAQRNLV